MNSDLDNLRWVRAFSPDVIPKYLVEQVKGRDYSVQDFYKYQSLNCLLPGVGGPTLNPLNHLYVLADGENMVKGYAWMVVDPLTKDLIVNTYSIDKKFWNGGKSVKKLSDHVKSVMKAAGLKKVYWITNYPKHSENHGFKRSKHVIMEYSEVEDGEDVHGRSDAREEHLDAYAGAASGA